MCLTNTSIESTDRPGIINATLVESCQLRIASSLRDHCNFNSEAQKKHHYFSRLITKLSELRTVATYGHKQIHERIVSLQNQQQHMLANKGSTVELVAMSTICALQQKLGEDEETQQQSEMMESNESSTETQYAVTLPSISSVYPNVFTPWSSK